MFWERLQSFHVDICKCCWSIHKFHFSTAIVWKWSNSSTKTDNWMYIILWHCIWQFQIINLVCLRFTILTASVKALVQLMLKADHPYLTLFRFGYSKAWNTWLTSGQMKKETCHAASVLVSNDKAYLWSLSFNQNIVFLLFNPQWSETSECATWKISGDKFCYISAIRIRVSYAASASGKVKLDTHTYMSAKWLYCTVHVQH